MNYHCSVLLWALVGLLLYLHDFARAHGSAICETIGATRFGMKFASSANIFAVLGGNHHASVKVDGRSDLIPLRVVRLLWCWWRGGEQQSRHPLPQISLLLLLLLWSAPFHGGNGRFWASGSATGACMSASSSSPPANPSALPI
jgi:hypothetical protein